MEKDQEKELLAYFLPAGTLEYFDITHFVKDKEGLVLFLEEKNLPRPNMQAKHFTPKDFIRKSGYKTFQFVKTK